MLVNKVRELSVADACTAEVCYVAELEPST
jgi:hypothetical protein